MRHARWRLGRAAFDAQLEVYGQDRCVTTLSPTLPYEIQVGKVGSPVYLGEVEVANDWRSASSIFRKGKLVRP